MNADGKANSAFDIQAHHAMMSNWQTIRLELDCTADFPGGSVSRGYLLQLPLSDTDHVDEAAFAARAYRANFRRHWSTEPDEAGQILRSGDDWILARDGHRDRILKLGAQPLRLGQHVSVIEPDGTALPFRIAGIR